MVRSRSIEGMDSSAAAAATTNPPPPRPPPPNPAVPYREDCWSEGATSALVDAWGDLYLDLSRGNLRQKHWQEVADAVNSRPTAFRRPPRTDVQCKNRIDTLKKKYKAEKARIAGSGGSFSSQWPFYSRLDALVGSSASPLTPPVALPLPYRKNSPLPPPAAIASRPNKRPTPVQDKLLRKGSFSAAAAAAAAAAQEDEVESEPSRSSTERSGKKRLKVMNGESGGEVDGVRELARAILKFGEIYERVESAKQKQMIDLEKQRMEFTKEIEFQRLQMFVDSQVELLKINRAKRVEGTSGADDKSGLDLFNFQLIKMLT